MYIELYEINLTTLIYISMIVQYIRCISSVKLGTFFVHIKTVKKFFLSKPTIKI